MRQTTTRGLLCGTNARHLFSVCAYTRVYGLFCKLRSGQSVLRLFFFMLFSRARAIDGEWPRMDTIKRHAKRIAIYTSDPWDAPFRHTTVPHVVRVKLFLQAFFVWVLCCFFSSGCWIFMFTGNRFGPEYMAHNGARAIAYLSHAQRAWLCVHWNFWRNGNKIHIAIKMQTAPENRTWHRERAWRAVRQNIHIYSRRSVVPLTWIRNIAKYIGTYCPMRVCVCVCVFDYVYNTCVAWPIYYDTNTASI